MTFPSFTSHSSMMFDPHETLELLMTLEELMRELTLQTRAMCQVVEMRDDMKDEALVREISS